MMNFSFIHAADLHLGSPFVGLGTVDPKLAALVASASRDALDDLVTQAIELKVAFFVIAGDVYDGDWKDTTIGLFFHSQMSRLERAAFLSSWFVGTMTPKASLPRPSDHRRQSEHSTTIRFKVSSSPISRSFCTGRASRQISLPGIQLPDPAGSMSASSTPPVTIVPDTTTTLPARSKNSSSVAINIGHLAMSIPSRY